jgi:nucleoside phosphorylase/predicted TIM-barrel fold metal-dependent hydrolase
VETLKALVLTCSALAGLSAAPQHAQSPPGIDHHQHLFSPATSALARGISPVSAGDLVRLLDEAGIRRAAVFSLAYQFGNPNKPPVDDEYGKVKAENNWTSAQVARFPDRLRGFCSVNPLKDYALEEVNRCAEDSHLRFGLKLHFGNSDVDVENPRHVAKLRSVFRTANANRMAIVVHLRASVTRRRPYGKTQARVFLNDVMPAAPDVPVQIAHLAGAGGYDDPAVDEALRVFIQAIASADPRTAHVYFDVSGVAGIGQWKDKANLIASRIRQLGVQRVLYGSDGTTDLLRPRSAWAAFRSLPLSNTELHTIASNVAPYMRKDPRRALGVPQVRHVSAAEPAGARPPRTIRLLVLVSANAEWTPTKAVLAPQQVQRSPYGEFFTHVVAGEPVLFMHGGWGKIDAAASAEYAISRWRPKVVINLGTCGGIEGRIQRGDRLLVTRTVVYDIQEAMGDASEAIDAYSTDVDLTWLGNDEFPVRVRRAMLLSGDRDLVPAALPTLLQRFPDAVAADWESGAIARVAKRRGTRLIIVRAVSDLVGTRRADAMNNLPAFQDSAAAIMRRLLTDLRSLVPYVLKRLETPAGQASR